MEDDIQKQCEEILKKLNIKYIHLENKASSKYRYIGSRKFVGYPDLIIFLKNAKTIFVELKYNQGVQSAKQKDFQQYSIDNGYCYYICRSVNEFLEVLKINK